MNLRKLSLKGCKLLIVAAALLQSLTANAEGYQINTLSARQLGMGHTGVALKLGAENMLFNPAGMSFMNSKFDIAFGATGIRSKVKYENGSYTAKTDNPLGTPFYGHLAYKVSDKIAVGVSINNPIGNALKWPDNWGGATLIEEINLKGFSVQPTVSYKFSQMVSVGAGLMLDFGNFSLQRALIPVGGTDAIGTLIPQLQPLIDSYQGLVPLSAKLTGNANLNVGFNIGILVNISEKVSLGASYRSKVLFKVKNGEAELNYANENVKKVIDAVNTARPGTIIVPPLNEGTFEASLPAPRNINVGVSYKPIKDLTLTGELQFVGWQAYDTLTVQFDQNVLDGYSIKAPKCYKNTVQVRIGAEYVLSDFATVRFGGYFDKTPVQDNLYNPETPGSNKFGITTGATINPLEYLSIDFSFGYVAGKKRYGSYPNPTTSNPNHVFDGYYKAQAFMPALGVRLRF